MLAVWVEDVVALLLPLPLDVVVAVGVRVGVLDGVGVPDPVGEFDAP